MIDQIFMKEMSRKRRAESSSDDEGDEFASSSEDPLSPDSDASSEDDGSNNEEDLVNCDFEFFDPQKQDFLGIKHMLRQLFDKDADLFDLNALTEMVLAQPLVGSTVKTEGHEGDPLSFLTVLNLRVHKDNSAIKGLVKYFMDKSKSDSRFHEHLSNLLEGETNGDVALVLSERIINMPTAVAAPSYRMLLEEIQWANEDKEPYEFSHFLIVSRTYLQEEGDSDIEDGPGVVAKPRSKRQRRKEPTSEDDQQCYHPEDELFLQSAAKLSYSFTNRDPSDESNLKTSGLLLLIERSQFEAAITHMEEFLGIETQ